MGFMLGRQFEHLGLDRLDPKRPMALVDRDGTLASLHNAPQDRSDASWREYNAALPFDAPVPRVRALVRSLRAQVVMTSGRMAGDHPGDRRRLYAMRDWTVKHEIPVDAIMMRQGGDTRRDSIVKAEMLGHLRERGHNPQVAIDDRPEVVDTWRKHGLHVVAVRDPHIPPPIARQR